MTYREEWFVINDGDLYNDAEGRAWAWKIGPDPLEDDERERLLVAARLIAGMPAGDGWTGLGEPWGIHRNDGEIPKLTAHERCEVSDRIELTAWADLHPAEIETYRAEHAMVNARREAEQALAHLRGLAGLDPTAVQDALAMLREINETQAEATP